MLKGAFPGISHPKFCWFFYVYSQFVCVWLSRVRFVGKLYQFEGDSQRDGIELSPQRKWRDGGDPKIESLG